MERRKVIVGMSGGVDSAVAAYLLREQGLEVVAVTLRSWEADESRCCEIEAARRTAEKLSLPFYPWNVSGAFQEKVIRPFVEEYLHGRTPNPCVECNRYVKWESLLHIADVMGAGFVATGHYADLKCFGGRYAAGTAKDRAKDQSYMLYRLTQEQLSRTMLPLSELTKAEVREIAAGIDPGLANKADSQEVCFVPDDDYAGFIAGEAGGEMPGMGNFLDENGTIVGRHNGIVHYTVGQRKGLGLAMGVPVYVKKICADRNEIIVGREEALYSHEILCDRVNFMRIPQPEEGERINCRVKIRYHHAGHPARIEMAGQSRVRVTFDGKVKAAAPGQSAVFYDDDGFVLGGGIITETFGENERMKENH